MKRLSQTMVLLTAISFALPMQAACEKQLPNPVSGSTTWTPTQLCLAGAVAGLAAWGLFYVYNRWINPAPAASGIGLLTSPFARDLASEFNTNFAGINALFDAATPKDVRQIASGNFRGVTCRCSKGRCSEGQEAYLVEMQRGSSRVSVWCSDISSLSTQVKGYLEGMFNVGVVNQADIETFLRARFN